MGNKKMNAGIYKITNIINGKMYIGSTNNLANRRDNHFSELKRNSHPNRFLQRSVNKYGISNFQFDIIEHCLLEELNIKEGFWCGQLNTYNDKFGYNLTIVNLNGLHEMPQHVKDILRKVNLGRKASKETREKQSIAKLNKKHTLEHAALCSKTLVFGIRDAEHKEKLRKSRLNPVLQFDLNGIFIKEFESIREAEISLGLKSRSNICACCNGRQKTDRGFIWKYKNKK